LSEFTDFAERLEKIVDEFEASLPKIEEGMARKVTALLKELDLRRNGDVAVTVRNLRKVRRLRRILDGVIKTPAYEKEVSKLLDAYNLIEDVNDKFFTRIVKDFEKPAILAEIKKLAVDDALESLTGSGLQSQVVENVLDIISSDVKSGVSFGELVSNVRSFINGTPEQDGKMVRYSKQIVRDSIFQYSGSYNKALTEDLGLEWFRYVGGTVKDSRELCINLVEKEWIHASELPNIVDGLVNVKGKMVQVELYKGKPQGQMPATNAENFQIKRGGFNCMHLMQSVSESQVPKEYRELYKN